MAHITLDKSANALVVVAPDDVDTGIKAIASAIDVKNPTDIQVDAQQLRTITPATAIGRLSGVFPSARFVSAPNSTVVVMARPSDMGQIKAILSAIDSPTPTPSAKPHYPSEAVRVTQRNARDIAKAVAAGAPGVKVSVAGNQLLLSGQQDDVDHAKALIAQLDVPPMNAQYTQLYRLKYVDAGSVARLLARSFPNLPIQVDTDLNAITVLAADTLQHRIADAIAQLDTPPGGSAGPGGAAGGGGGGGVEVITLNAAIPGLNGAPSSTATDLATTVTQALQQQAPDLHITVPPNSTRLILTGSPYSIKLGEDLIQQLDVPQPQIVLDTEIYEVSETIAKDLGISFPEGSATISTTFQEETPAVPSGSTSGTPPPLTSIEPFYRTVPLQFTLQMGLAIQDGKAKVLADPRITTISGRTASIRAGDTISILTTTGGGTGTVATTQVQQFQTGVTLDITPVVNAGNFITITLHPTVNNETGLLNGVPQISTRDTTTTVQMADNTTLIIGGLIQRTDQVNINKIPVLGDLPLIGKVFQQQQVNNSDDELVITVTPHIVRDTNDMFQPGPPMPTIPCYGILANCGASPKPQAGSPSKVAIVGAAQSPSGLPTLPPNAKLPPPSKATPVPVVVASTSRSEPQPVQVPTPLVPLTPPPTSGPAARPAHMSSSPAPGSAPTPPGANPLPTAFAQTNVYTFGAAPPNNYAAANQPPQIFYIQVSPSVVANGQAMTISAITSTNVTKLTFGPSAIIQNATLNSIGPGQWQASFNFSTSGLTVSSGNVQFVLSATTSMGQAVSVPIPLSVVNQ